jgi:predicted metal-dependent HD superfamily phosphohydrolase
MDQLIEEVEKYVSILLSTELESSFVYHNLAHTQRVVSNAKELIELEELDPENANLLTIAAWFHDTGYTKQIINHEEESITIAEAFLRDKGLSPEDLETIYKLIRVTHVINKPKNKIEAILKDADCAHVSSSNYEEYASLLKKEWELTSDKFYDNTEWIKINIDFISEHVYYTISANSNWVQQKNKNLAKLLRKLDKTKKGNLKIKQKKESLSLKKDKLELPDRGIQTMFRVALRNHITLSDIADTKANILLSVNAIIISVALSNLIPKLDNPSNDYLIYPTLIFLVFTVICIVLSVIATRPNVTEGKFTKKDVMEKKVNILFFGNFHQMKLEDFDWAMQEVMEDKRYLYGNLTKDLYYLGLVLNRKYNLLRTTYTVFMVGIVVSVISFGIAFFLGGGNI